MDQATFAKELSRVSGIDIPYDSYRKYEILDPKKGALLRHDLMFAFCEITRTHLSALLAGDPFQKVAVIRSERRKAS